MPHLFVRRFAAAQTPRTPFESNGVKFLFVSAGDDGIVGAEANGCRFLLRYVPRGDRTLLKADKITRPPFLDAVKRALIELAASSGATIEAKNFDEIKQAAIGRGFYDPNAFIASLDRSKKLWIEVGFGSGRHILQNAESFADKIHLGVEIHHPSAERLLKRAEAKRANNIAAVLCDAKTLFAAMPAACCERIFLHFPVPWDKSPSRRVFSPAFANEALRILEANGVLHLRTDSEAYFAAALEIAQKLEGATAASKTGEEAITRSKYEDRWRKMNKTIFDLFLTNLRDRETANIAYNFDFPSGCAAKNEIGRDLIAKAEAFLLRATKKWQLEGGGSMTRLIMGDPNALQNLYLLTERDRVSYFPAAPLPTRANLLAHQALIEALYG
ncbi:MAG: tRNA (guanosine(46)-N7)-methyltransferase TrmB [Helicobacteraceae bacterium]|jgi:tRNA (guanine-N7-)-methyltransferase|nr:tRNA (guanosine(46)-N7)-methyltransferase TrmB [Helicobacteraceae bacterium]